MISFVYGTDVSDLKTLKQQQRFKLFQVIYFEQQQKLEKKRSKSFATSVNSNYMNYSNLWQKSQEKHDQT